MTPRERAVEAIAKKCNHGYVAGIELAATDPKGWPAIAVHFAEQAVVSGDRETAYRKSLLNLVFLIECQKNGFNPACQPEELLDEARALLETPAVALAEIGEGK